MNVHGDRWERLDASDSPPSSLPCNFYGSGIGVLILEDAVFDYLVLGGALSLLCFVSYSFQIYTRIARYVWCLRHASLR